MSLAMPPPAIPATLPATWQLFNLTVPPNISDATAEVGRRSARDRQVAQPQLPAGAINLEDPDRVRRWSIAGH